MISIPALPIMINIPAGFGYQAFRSIRVMYCAYHWRAIDADHVVVWRGWYSVNGEENLACANWPNKIVRNRQEDIHLESVQKGSVHADIARASSD